MIVKNSDKSKTFVSKVCGYYPKFSSKATEWDISNEAVARRNYTKKIISPHRNLTVTKPGLFIDIENPFIGASPDGLVSCSCHESGLLEIKCPWSSRNLTITEFAKKNNLA